MNYYLFILKKTKIIACVRHVSVDDAVSHLLNWGDIKPKYTDFKRTLFESEQIDNVLLQKFSHAISYSDGTVGVVFSGDYSPIANSSRLMNDISSNIKSLERHFKINEILSD